MMKTQLPLRLLSLTLSLATALRAQKAPEDKAPEDKAPEDIIYTLSPFTVEARTDDEGYHATSTLAGTRLKTDLKDLGAAISVFTEEIFEDTGATSADTVLAYGLNTEVAGVHGNFTDVAPSTDGRATTVNTRSNSQEAQRIRGLAEATLTRGYFLTSIPFDSYNSSEITINRGPNSLLFGIGSPGGVIDTGVKQASMEQDAGELSIRIGERGSNRETIDYNKAIIKGRLGLRVAGLHESTEYQQRPAYQEDKRIYAAVNALLLKHERSRVLGPLRFRGNVESGSIRGTPPNPVPFSDALTAWFEVPDNLSQIVAITGVPAAPFTQNFTSKYTVNNSFGNVTAATLERNGGPTENPYFIQMPYIYADPNSAVPSVGLADPTVAGVQARIRWAAKQARNVPDYIVGNSELFATEHYFGKNRAGPVRAPGFAYPVVQDRRIYDNEDLLLSGTSNRRDQEFDVVSLALEQTFFGGDGGLEVAYDRQKYENSHYLPFSDEQFQDVKVDISETLANGQANPNFGRAFIWETGTAARQRNRNVREAARATGFYELDFNEKKASWLGRHVFTGFLGTQKIDQTNYNYRNVFVDIGDTNVRSAMNDGVTGFRRSIPIQVYLTGSLLGSEVRTASDVRITRYFTGSVPKPGDIAKIQYNSFNPVFGTDTDRLLEDEFGVEQFLVGGGRSRQEIDSKAVSWQSFFFGGNVVGLLGWRADESRSTNRIKASAYRELTGVNNFQLADGSIDPGSLILGHEADDVAAQEGNTATWSIVAHVPRKWLRLPGESQVSLHYNESENFSSSGVRRDFYGRILPAPAGETRDYGASLTLLQGRVSLRLNFFETNNSYATVINPGVGAPSWISQGMQRYKDSERSGDSLAETLAKSTKVPNAAALFGSYDDLYNEMLAVLPEPVSSRFEGFSAQGDPVFAANPGQSVTQSFVGKGLELDVVSNLTKNWRVALNFAEQRTVTSDTAPVARDFVLAVKENLEASVLGDLIVSPPQNEAETFSEVWNRLQVNPLTALLAKDGTVSGEQRRYRANLITNYTFPEGKLAGFGVGGGLRWQSKVATGYQIAVGEAGLVTPLLDRPFYGPDLLNGDAWISYKRRLRGRFGWKIQLNVRNLIRNDGYIPVVTNPDGRVAIVRNPNPQEIFLTNTFSF